MQIRSANSSANPSASRASHRLNPMVIAFDRNWNELYRKPLSQIEGMAYGTREDYENGYRGIKHNWCIGTPASSASPASTPRVFAWSVLL